MRDYPLVSILINNYNYGRFLGEAIDSALNQTYPNIEVIVVDDGSTDNSKDIIAGYKERIRPILKENGGQASAFNTGFAASQGDIVCFLDADDIFLPEKAGKIVDIFTKNQDIGWCFHALSMVNSDFKKVFENIYRGASGRYDLTLQVQRGKLAGKMPFDGTATSAICFRRSFLASLLPMPEAPGITLHDDYLKYISLGISPGYILLEELALQRLHNNNASTNRKDKRGLQLKNQSITAYWMKTSFPVLSKFSNNLLAVGLSQSWSLDGVDSEHQEIIRLYLEKATPLEKLEIFLRATYYRFKP
jgi:glycosyltransferase involved in cell wall biosynthesis